MTLQARKSSQRQSPDVASVKANGVGRALVDLARLAATERSAAVASAVARYVCESLNADGALIIEYGTTPGRIAVEASHGDDVPQAGAHIPSAPLLTPALQPIAASIIDAPARSQLPGNDKARAILAVPVPGPYTSAGSIVALFQKPREFSEDDIASLELLASLLGGAQQKDAASTELAGSLGLADGQTATPRSREHAVFAGMARAVAESPDLETALASICEWTAELISYDRMVVGMVSSSPPGFARTVFAGRREDELPAGQAYLLTTDELDQLITPQANVTEPLADDPGSPAGMRVPIVHGAEPVAVLWLGSDSADTYSQAAFETLLRLADYLGPIIESAAGRDAERQTARQASDSAQHLAAVLAAAPVALVAVDATGMCTLVEGRLVRDMGAFGNLIKGHSLFELTGRHPEVEEVVRFALKGVPGNALLKVGRRSLELTVRPVHGKQGNVDGAIIVGSDVTERTVGRAALEEVKQLHLAQEERARLMSAVSHELKTPLTSIVAFIDILALNQPGNLTSDQAQALSVVQKSAERLDRLIGDLHDLSRMEAGMFALDVKAIEVGVLLQYLTDTYQPLMAARGQSLVVENEARGWEVNADELRLTQAVANLLSNASKYSPEGTEVTLAAAVDGDSLELAVIDQGPGIPEELHVKVFDAFYRVENEQTRSAPGSGLGLAIVKRIVDLHGGSVCISSEPKGGTRVAISIPGACGRSETASAGA